MISSPLLPGLRTSDLHKSFPPRIFPFRKDGSGRPNCGYDSIWAEGGAVEDELGYFTQATLDWDRDGGRREEYIKLSSPPLEFKRLHVTASFPALCKSRVPWVSPSPSYSVL